MIHDHREMAKAGQDALSWPAQAAPMASAPRDGTRVLAWLRPEPIRLSLKSQTPGRVVQPPGRFVLVRWFGSQGAGHWSTHHQGTGKIKGDLVEWWPLPEESRGR